MENNNKKPTKPTLQQDLGKLPAPCHPKDLHTIVQVKMPPLKPWTNESALLSRIENKKEMFLAENSQQAPNHSRVVWKKKEKRQGGSKDIPHFHCVYMAAHWLQLQFSQCDSPRLRRSRCFSWKCAFFLCLWETSLTVGSGVFLPSRNFIQKYKWKVSHLKLHGATYCTILKSTKPKITCQECVHPSYTRVELSYRVEGCMCVCVTARIHGYLDLTGMCVCVHVCVLPHYVDVLDKVWKMYFYKNLKGDVIYHCIIIIPQISLFCSILDCMC